MLEFGTVIVGGRKFRVRSPSFKGLMELSGTFMTIRRVDGKLKLDTPEDFADCAEKLIKSFSVLLNVRKGWLEKKLKIEEMPELLKKLQEVVRHNMLIYPVKK